MHSKQERKTSEEKYKSENTGRRASGRIEDNRDEKKQLCYENLPRGYDLYEVIDFAKNPGNATKIAWSGLAVTAAMIAMALPDHSLKTAVSMHPFRIGVAVCFMLIGFLVYILLHEGVHGFFIKMFTGENAEFGLQMKAGMAYASSRYFFGKAAYIIIALAPVIVWGIVLTLLLKDVPECYWWYLYAVQILNISGCVGDLFVTYRILKAPKGTLVLDSGMSMKFFAKTSYES